MLRKIILLLLALIVAACSTIEKTKLSSNNTKDAIIEVQNLRDAAAIAHVDLLAYEDFTSGETLLNTAIKNLNKIELDNETFDDLAHSKSYFLRAQNTASKKNAIPERILDARKATLLNGVKENIKLTQRLSDIDESLRKKSDNFKKDLTVENFSILEKDYLLLEIDSVKNSQLNSCRNILAEAQKKSAHKTAPKSYFNANKDLKAAENMIQQSPRNPENYQDSVADAKKSSRLLGDVMEKLDGIAQGASEDAALILVYQERKLEQLSSHTNTLKGELSRSQFDLGNVSNKLDSKTGEALKSAKQVQQQAEIEDVRKKFSSSEAEVYQQGNDLIIRLKKIDFKFGSAVIPSESLALLSKVNSVIINLHSSKVAIEGHTDSIGENEQNQILSVGRSESVARYLESFGKSYVISSKGFGESRPIANNETQSGRMINRRVDIVITTGEKI